MVIDNDITTMTKFTFVILTVATACNSGQQKERSSVNESVAKPKLETTEFTCDTIYPSKNYKIELTKFDTTVSESDTIYNTILALSKNNQIIFSDSIHNAYNDVGFEDFNGDSVKDILVQNTSSARSNWTYTLYLVDTLNDKLTKVKGFDQICNPRYLAKYDIIDNYVLCGRNRTEFYKIQGDTIIDFNIHIEDDLSDSSLYQREYKSAIDRIMKLENKR